MRKQFAIHEIQIKIFFLSPAKVLSKWEYLSSEGPFWETIAQLRVFLIQLCEER